MPHSVVHCDFHVHTNWSPDATVEPAEVVARARAAGLDRIAITDHHEIRGAVAARALAPDLVIVGEEVTADCGTDVLGLYVTQRIPAGGTIEEIAAAIRAQGGIVYAPHPCAYPTRGDERWARLLAVADVFEVINGRAFWPRWNRDAARRAGEAACSVAGGSDAHSAAEVGSAYAELPAFRGAAELRAALPAARPILRDSTSPVRVAFSVGLHVASRIGIRPFRPSGSQGQLWPVGDVWGARG